MAGMPPPIRTALVDKDGNVTKVWGEYFRALADDASNAIATDTLIGASSQSASIGLTDLITSPAAGLYRVTWRVRIAQAATTSSSVLVTVTTTDGSVTSQESSAALTSNLVGGVRSGVFLVKTDAGAPIAYSTTYASVGTTPMLYDLDLVAEAL
jgi:hypothetical protein